MNAVAQVFVDAYEKDRDITPKELIDAGWTYRDLATYMQCCKVLSSVSIMKTENFLSGGPIQRDNFKEYEEYVLNGISNQLIRLVQEPILFDAFTNGMLKYSYNGHYNGVIYESGKDVSYRYGYNNDDPEWLCTIFKSEQTDIQTVGYFIGKYITKGIMCEWGHTSDITELSIQQAEQKKTELEKTLFKLESNEPEFDDDIVLSSFSNIHEWSKKIGEFISDRDDLEAEIETLEDYIDDPQPFYHRKREKFLMNSLPNVVFDIYNHHDELPSSALVSVDLSIAQERQKIIIINDAREKSDTNIWINRGFSQTILATLMQGLRDFEYKGEKHHICEATILSDVAIDILGDDTFRNPNKITTVYVYSYKHISNIEQNYTPVTAYVLCANRNMPVPFNVYYDKQGDRYFINETSYLEYAKQYGFPLMKLKTYAPNSTSFSMADLSDMSTLRLYGYTVSKNEGLTDGQRQKLLKNLMDSRLMSKTDILNHIEWIVNTHEGNYKYADACDKWTSDIRFVNQYRLDTQRSVWARLIPNK